MTSFPMPSVLLHCLPTAVGQCVLCGTIFYSFPLGLPHPNLVQNYLTCQAVVWERKYFYLGLSDNGPPMDRFLTKREMIITEMSIFGAAPNSFLPERGAKAMTVDWQGTRIPGGFLSQSQSTSPGALEALFLSTTASPKPTPHWSWTLPFHGQLAIISIMWEAFLLHANSKMTQICGEA